MNHLLKHPSHIIKLVALLLFFSVFNCQKEDINMLNQTQELSSVSYKITSLSKLRKLQPVVANIKKISPKNNTYNRGFSDFLPLENIDTARVIQYTDTTGYSTYTFKIESDDETSINFENLYLLETEQGYIGYILRYEPDENWYYSEVNYTPEGDHVFNIPTYQGDITKYSLEREVIWSTKEENMNRTTHSMRGQFVEVCVYSVVAMCDYGVQSHPWGDKCTGNKSFETVENCQTVWSSGGTGNEGDGSGDGDGSNNGGGTSGNDPCLTTGTTIIGQQPISGIGTACPPNGNTGVLITEVVTECLVSSHIISQLLGSLQINSFTQMELQDYIENSDNACQVGDMALFLQENNYSSDAKEAIIMAITDLSSYTETDYPGIGLDYEFEWWLDDSFIEENFNFGFDVGGGFDNLTAEEKVLVALFPAQALIIRENKEPAETETIIRFGNNGRNDKSDAFRHAFFNAMNSNDVGDIVARKFSNAHESETPPNLVLEKQMDLHNNNIGHNIGNNASTFISDQELSNLVYQSLIWGSLRYLSPLAAVIPPNFGITSSTQLIPTNQ